MIMTSLEKKHCWCECGVYKEIERISYCKQIGSNCVRSSRVAITKELIEHELNGMSLEEAMGSIKLFILDYNDLFLPFIKRIDSSKERKGYAMRTIFYLADRGLGPIVIELSLPSFPSNPLVRNTSSAEAEWMDICQDTKEIEICAKIFSLVNKST